MIDQQAKVVKIDEQTIWLDAQRQSTCSSCSVKQGCGTGLLAQHVGQKFSRIAIKNENHVAVEVGSSMQLRIPEQALIKGTAFMYLMPLMMMFCFAAVAQLMEMTTIAEVFLGLIGLAFGLIIVHFYFKNKEIGIDAKVVEAN
jgi:sigma-E factor negative regulatory protein RseC